MADFVLIDTDEMRFRKAARSAEQLEYWAELLIPAGNDFVITGGERRYYAKHSMMSLRLLYQNATGHELHTNDYAQAVQAVADIAANLPCDDTPVSVLATRLGRPLNIATERAGVIEAQLPKPEPASFVPPPWAANPAAAYRAPNVAPPLLSEQRVANAPPVRVVDRPRPGNTCAKVWEICDFAYVACRRDLKAMRAYVIEKASEMGINPATAATQCSRWVAANGF